MINAYHFAGNIKCWTLPRLTMVKTIKWENQVQLCTQHQTSKATLQFQSIPTWISGDQAKE